MGFIIFWSILASLSFMAIFYAAPISKEIHNRGLSGFQKSDMERVAHLRGILIAMTVVFIIFATGNFQMITGIIGMTIGSLVMLWATPIHRFLASGGGGSTWLRGDDSVRLTGVLIFFISALWLSGISQDILIWFFDTIGILPQSN